MTYFGFLVAFLVLPILLLAAMQCRRLRHSRALWLAIGVQVALALVYTTPWDNYLVASGVWYYDPHRVTGVVLGYVPLEEYVFFVLETLLVGLWWQLAWTREAQNPPLAPSARLRLGVAGIAAAAWLALTALFLSGWRPGTYLLITLVWAFAPVLLQLAYGADILWHRRRLLAIVILPIGCYLSVADAGAIRSGIWTIDPAQSTGLFMGSLPVEEGVFFFVTCILLAFGLTLTLAPESRERFAAWRSSLGGGKPTAQGSPSVMNKKTA